MYKKSNYFALIVLTLLGIWVAKLFITERIYCWDKEPIVTTKHTRPYVQKVLWMKFHVKGETLVTTRCMDWY